MGGRWNPSGFQFLCLMILIVFLEIRGCLSLNPEGLALLEFRSRVDSDPYGIFINWNPNDSNPCVWFGVHCVDTEVQILDLKELSLKGILTPELGKLKYLKSLVLHKNHFSGAIPKEIGVLTMLELLDLRYNDLTGTIPAEIGKIHSLKHLLLCNNKLEGGIPLEFHRLHVPSELQCDGNLSYAGSTEIGCMNRKIRHCTWQSSLKQINDAGVIIGPIIEKLVYFLEALPMYNFAKGFLHGGEKGYKSIPDSSHQHINPNMPTPIKIIRRRLLAQQITNLEASPAKGSSGKIISLPTSRSSGTFPAVPNEKMKPWAPAPAPLPLAAASLHKEPKPEPVHAGGSLVTGKKLKYAVAVPCIFLLLIGSVALLYVNRSRAAATIQPWKTGISGQLQKAFVTGVPKLNRSELETACEDFSNIIDILDDCTVYKGTLSSGVEIAVASTAVASSKDWSKRSEMAYRKKIDKLSRVNHKNFVNLIGYCEEDEPFNRMMVFEYAPNGTLFEHLHVKEMEHLDWHARMRVIMGVAYCLQYMHHDLNPPLSHTNLISSAIYLTDDYAGKLAEISFSPGPSSKFKLSGGEDRSGHRELPPYSDPEANVYSFGILLLEIISGKRPYSPEQGSLLDWAGGYLSERRSMSRMIDPSLKSFKDNDLEVIRETVLECTQQDPRHRPTIPEVISKLRGAIAISPEAATPRLSPLWWAELEILSVEAS